MATNHTTNYQLNLWEPGDKFVRSEFNENTSKIDAALAAHENRLNAKADAAAVSALQTAVAGKGNCRIVTGSYTGTGDFGEDHPTIIEIPNAEHPPAVIFIRDVKDDAHVTLIRGMQRGLYTWGAYDRFYVDKITWTDKGVQFYNEKNAEAQLNYTDRVYFYVALM